MPQPTYSTSETDANVKVVDTKVTSVDAKVAALDARVTAVEASVAATTARVDGVVNDIAGIKTRLTALENATPPVPPEPPIPPDAGYLWDANFQKGGNVSGPVNGHLLLSGKPFMRIYGAGYNDTYGNLNGTKIQNYNEPACVTMTDAGVVLTGKMQSGFNVPSAGAFLGSRDTTGANAATQFPLPLYGVFTFDFTVDGFIEDFDSIWLRHEKGSGVGEIDLFETVSAQLTGEKGLQFGVPTLSLGQSAPVAFRSRFNQPVGQRVSLVMVCKPTTGNNATIKVTMNGKDPYATIVGNGNVTPPAIEWTYDRTKLEAQTTDPNHAWDLAFQKQQGFEWGAAIAGANYPYNGKTLRNGQPYGVPIGGATKSWDTKSKTSTLTVHRITVESL